MNTFKYKDIYLINWNLYFFQKENHYEFSDSITALIENKDFSDIQSLVNFIKTQENKRFIFPLHTVGKNYEQLFQFYHEILLKLLHMNLTNNRFYFFTNDPFFLQHAHGFPALFNNFLDLLYKSKNNNIKIINPIFNFEKVKFSAKQERGCLPLVNNYEHIVFFPYLHYCYKLAKLDINLNPVRKVLLSGAVHKEAYKDRFRLQNLSKKYPQYIAIRKRNSEELKSASNNYNLTLKSFVACFYSGVNNFDGNFILLKLYEILGSGSLLLLEKKSKNICDKLGLIENIHYVSIDFEDTDFNIMEKIKFILADDNRDYILKIRKQGMIFCHNNLDYNFSKGKFLDLMNKL